MGWKETDERLIKRGERILDLGFLENYKEELKGMNTGKVGHSTDSPPTTSNASPQSGTSTGCHTANWKDSPN